MPRIINKLYIAPIIIAVLLMVFFITGFYMAAAADKNDLEELNEQVEQKKDMMETIDSQISVYKNKISEKQTQISNLQDQMTVIENRIAKAELDIQAVRLEIEMLNLEITLINGQIIVKEDEINLQKQTLSQLIRRINKLDQRTYLDVLLANDSFSEFFDQVKYLEDIQDDLQTLLDQVQGLKSDLEDKRSKRETKKSALEDTRKELEQEQAELAEEINFKDILVQETHSSESMYQELLNELRQEHQYIDSQIVNLEETLRAKINQMDQGFESGGESVLSWPASPARGITAYFHDPTYPFRHLFEHSGIDLRLYQGTPVKAAAPGYVVWSKQGTMYGNFVMIVHSGGLSTIYAHLSQVNVRADQFVECGEVIGLSGGMPGTPGAGLSTGPHLHFEVRKNGIPTNPLNYLINF